MKNRMRLAQDQHAGEPGLRKRVGDGFDNRRTGPLERTDEEVSNLINGQYRECLAA
jgi:hypothetical protein